MADWPGGRGDTRTDLCILPTRLTEAQGFASLPVCTRTIEWDIGSELGRHGFFNLVSTETALFHFLLSKTRKHELCQPAMQLVSGDPFWRCVGRCISVRGIIRAMRHGDHLLCPLNEFLKNEETQRPPCYMQVGSYQLNLSHSTCTPRRLALSRPPG